jgi:hypothetical protein
MAEVTAGGGSAANMDDWMNRWVEQFVMRSLFKTMLKTQTDPAPSGQVVSAVANSMARAVAFGK